MKLKHHSAAILCSLSILSSATHAELLSDNLNEPHRLNPGESISGQFTTAGTLIDNAGIRSAVLVLTVSDDGEAGTLLGSSSGTSHNTQTVNGLRTATKIITTTERYTDEEADGAQVIIGSQSMDISIDDGSYRYLASRTIEGPTPVPADECFITAGFYFSCQNVIQTDTYHSLSGATGETTVRIDIGGTALVDLQGSGTLSYSVTATMGDLIVQDAILELNQTEGSLSLSTYEATHLQNMFTANALNNNGDVVGQTYNTGDGWPHAALWQNGTVTDLGMHGCRDTVSHCWSHAYGINDQGQMVGESHTELSWPSLYFGPWSIYYAHEAMWQDANTPLAFMRTLGWEYGKTLDINANGHAVGHGRSVDWQRVAGDYIVHGFLWLSNDEIVEFGDYGQASKAFALNDSDQVVGEINVGGATRAFMWANGSMTLLGDFGGGYSSAADINNAGQIVGSARNTSGQSRAFLWQNGVMYPLEALADTVSSRALAINDAGIVVGEMDGRAVAWQGGQLVELNALIDASAGLQLVKAMDINNQDQILAKTAAGFGNYLLTSVTPPPADIYVCTAGCDASTLQAGLDMAPPGGTVMAYPGTYNEKISITYGKTLISWKGPQATIIDAQGLGGTTVTVGAGIIDGFTITGGSATYGGGINVRYGTAQNNIITGNNADTSGGGLFVNSYSNGTVLNNTFSNNTSGRYGGAIAYSGYSTITMRNNVFTGNSSMYGGAVFLGAYATETFSGNIVKGNSATYGGGVFIGGYSGGQVVNSIISDNTATYGGGIYAGGYSSGQIINSTVINNSDGIFVAGYSYARVTNTIIWGNTGIQINRPRYGGPNVSYSLVQGGTVGAGNLDSDPLFVDAANGNFRLAGGSPAIDTGADTSAINGAAVDADGVSRPQDGDGQGTGTTGDGSDYDMGAYEFH